MLYREFRRISNVPSRFESTWNCLAFYLLQTRTQLKQFRLLVEFLFPFSHLRTKKKFPPPSDRAIRVTQPTRNTVLQYSWPCRLLFHNGSYDVLWISKAMVMRSKATSVKQPKVLNNLIKSLNYFTQIAFTSRYEKLLWWILLVL